MCSILGEVGYISSDREFSELLALSKNRGPDDTHIVSAGDGVRFGFNRLAILDLSQAGRQPMVSPNGRWLLAFNGEVYNHRKLRRELDYPFKGHADSETILAALVHWGFEQTIVRLNGMFALAAYDTMEKRLWLARDFAGVKPLFYGLRNGVVVFASRFDQVYQHPVFRAEQTLLPEEMKAFFALGYMQAPGTVFKDIYQVVSGQWLCFQEGQLKAKRYFRRYEANPTGTIRETDPTTLKQLEVVFRETVQDQLVADVPLAVFLSGGIDSPLVAAVAREFQPDIVAYTLGVDDPQLDESEAARRYAKAMGIRHCVQKFSGKDLLGLVDEHFASFGEPFADYSSLPAYLVTKLATAKNKVMLSGDGGDELFYGYPRFLHTLDHFLWFRWPRSVRKLVAAGMRRNGYQVSYGVSAFQKVEEWVFQRHVHQVPAVLNAFVEGITYPKQLLAHYTPPAQLESKKDLLQFLRWNEFYAHLQRVLIKVDRASMGNSLEIRVPFLDRRVLDFAWKLQPGLGSEHRTPKYLLRKLLAKLVGEKRVSTEKKGFGVPVRQWLQGELREEVSDLLLSTHLFGAQYLDEQVVRQTVSRFLSQDQCNEWGIWILYAWQKWASQNQLI